MEGSQLIVPGRTGSRAIGNFSHRDTWMFGEDNDELILQMLAFIGQIWTLSSCLQIVSLIYLSLV